MSWGLVGLAVGSLVAYLAVLGGPEFLALYERLKREDAEALELEEDEL